MEVATSTPTTSAPAAPAAVSTPVSGGTTTASASATPVERPKTFAEAFARDAVQPTSDTSTQPEGATTPPVDATDQASAIQPSTDAKGPIPFEVHSKALDNARTKAVAEYREKYGWAESVPRESLERFSSIATSMTSDPIGFLNQFVAELQANPQHAAALRSNAGRLLGARGPQAPDLTPDVQITDETGRVVGTTFSAEKVKALLEHSVQERLAPLQQESDQRKAERDRQSAQQAAEAKAAEEKRQFNAVVEDKYSQVLDHLGIDESTPIAEQNDVLKQVKALMDADPQLTAPRAAARVANQRAQGKVLESLKTKAAAQAINPAGAVVAASSRPKSFLDKSLKW